MYMSEFRNIIKKYNLDTRADEVTEYLFSGTISAKQLSTKFDIEEKDAQIIIDTVKQAIAFKEKYLDNQEIN